MKTFSIIYISILWVRCTNVSYLKSRLALIVDYLTVPHMVCKLCKVHAPVKVIMFAHLTFNRKKFMIFLGDYLSPIFLGLF